MGKKNHKQRSEQPNTISEPLTDTSSTETTVDATSLPTLSNTSRDDMHTPAETRITFSTFIAVATMKGITDFLELAVMTPEGENLVNLWERAFSEGYECGRRSLLQNLKEKMEKKFEEGVEEGHTTATEEFDKATRAREDSKTITIDAGTQTSRHPEIDSPTHVTTSLFETPRLHTNSPQPCSTTNFDWAEDSNSIPIIYKPPRNLSVLRSDTCQPFASLRRRQPRRPHLSKSRFAPGRYRKPEWAGSPVVTHRHPFGIGFGKPRIPSPARPRDRLPEPNWDSDPRFKDLSRALRALGWIPAGFQAHNEDVALFEGG
jgi:hypothetical protein